MLIDHLRLLMSKSSLSLDEAEAAMEVMVDDANPHQIAAFLAILKYRSVSPTEVAGMIKALQKKALAVTLPFPVLDIVGTGGDSANTVNISTGSAILAAACGVPIAKHGNRSISSRSGSADVLEALEIDIEAPPNQIKEYLRHVGIAFMFAPAYHPSLKKISLIRRGLKFPTVFNILGPLLNPANAQYALIGVSDLPTLELMSKVILELDQPQKRIFIFHGSGLDELTPLGKVIAYDIYNGQRNYLEIDPVSLGFSPCSLKNLQGGGAQTNASLLKIAFGGEQGAIADALIFTAGTACWIFGQTSSLNEGILVAREALQEGKALKVLEKWVNLSKQLKVQRKE